MMVFSIMPIAVAVLQRHYGFREGQLGDIVGCYFIGVVLASLTTFAWIRRFNWRVVALAGQTISAVAFFMMMPDQGYIQLSVLLVAAGIGGGITYALAFTLLGDSGSPDRAFGINICYQTALSTLMFLVLPEIFSNNSKDLRRMAFVMGATVVVATLGVFWIPTAGPKGITHPESVMKPHQLRALGLPLLGTVATFLLMLACAAPWVFIEQAAIGKGLDPTFIDFSLGGAQFVAIAGSFAAAVIGNRFGKLRPMCAAAAVYLLGLYFLDIFHGREVFALGACTFLLPINFVLAFSLGLTSEVDVGGNLIGLSTISLLGPSLVAPSIAGRLYERYGFLSNLYVGALAMIAGLGLYCLLLQLAHSKNLFGTQKKGAMIACSDGLKGDLAETAIATPGHDVP